VQGAVEQVQALGDEDVGGVLGLGRLVQPAGGRLLAREGVGGSHRRHPRQRQGGRLGLRLQPAAAAPAARGGGRRAQRLQDEDALSLLGAGEVASVDERQGAGEVELRESE
jgi:hypothetical protein